MGFFTTVGGAALISSAGSMLSGAKNREFARSQRDFQAKREDTAIQRRVADMRAAGINPILAVPQGAASAAGMQMGYQPDVGQAAATGMEAGAQAELSSAQVAREQAMVEKIQEEVELIAKQQGLTAAETEVAWQRASFIYAQKRTEIERLELVVAQGDVEKARAALEKIYADFAERHNWVEVSRRAGITGVAAGASAGVGAATVGGILRSLILRGK